MKKPYKFLTYSGAFPFIAASLLIAFGIESLPVLGEVRQILSAYALAIISFIAGSYWNIYLNSRNSLGYALAIISNLIVVLIWLCYLTLPLKPLLLVFVGMFFVLLGIDKILLKSGLITDDYFYVRLFATLVVVSALIVAGVFV